MYLHEDKELFREVITNTAICANDFYRQDYINITEYFINDMVKYEQAVDGIIELADSGMFDE